MMVPINRENIDDLNGNGQYDPGFNQVFKQGAIIALSNNQDINSNILNLIASGYRLPSYPVWATAMTGGNYKKNLAMGRSSLFRDQPVVLLRNTIQQPCSKNIVYLLNIAPEFNGPSKATDRQPNGFDLYDMLGNLAEWSEHVLQV